MALPICGECAKVAAVRVITRRGDALESIMRCDDHAHTYLQSIAEPDSLAIDLTICEVHRVGGTPPLAARA